MCVHCCTLRTPFNPPLAPLSPPHIFECQCLRPPMNGEAFALSNFSFFVLSLCTPLEALPFP